MKNETSNPFIQDDIDPQGRQWEEFYRNRWSHDKVVRSTHGVNCTGSCSWNIHVKEGIVAWEMQALDYPKMEAGIPPMEPRGCQRGISFSWYLYSPLRVKYPYIRGALLDLWREARSAHDDPVDAWRALMSDPEKRARYQRARGKGGLRRASWQTVEELIAASTVYTIQDHGPDRVVGFSPIPAMSMLSYAAGSRMLQLMGAVNLSFYDWYCDLPNASPEVWGEQTDVQESADWFNAKFLAVMGANLNMTRTPDVHFASEARINGSKMVVFSPDFSQVAKFADEWISINAGQDGAWWMAVNHVILKEFHHEQQVPGFLDYTRTYTDSPYLVELIPHGKVRKPDKMLRAGRLAEYADEENGEWKFLQWDRAEDRPKMPMGSVGHRWGETQGKWNLLPKDGKDGSDIDAELTFLSQHDGVATVKLDDFAGGTQHERGVPYRVVQTADGEEVWVTTVYDLLMAQYGVGRGLPGSYPESYDEDAPYTPAWAERYTGMDRQTLIRFAREWAVTAEKTGGKCTVIIGAGINHWYHANLMYRAAIHALAFCGCIGKNGGGLAHYVGQEKLAPMDSWASVALAKDWYPASRLMNAPSWHYVHCDQWRYEKSGSDYNTVPEDATDPLARAHSIDVNVRAVRNGWLPFFPQFDQNPLEVVKAAQAAGAKTPAEIETWVKDEIVARRLKFAIERPDAPECWPRVWFIWRGNALMSSAKGHEYFLHHYLGTHTNKVGQDLAEDAVHEVEWVPEAPSGKMDLVVDLNFRMDTTALYSDIILPAATWYEKADLNSTDMHAYIHPLSPAVPPCWESKSDWDIFKGLAKVFSKLAEKHLPGKTLDVITAPLAHDTPAEIAQPELADWAAGECVPVPGKTMPNIKVMERDYSKLYDQFCSYGRGPRIGGLGAHGTHYDCADFYDELQATRPVERWGGETYPSLAQAEDAANVVLHMASVTNGELAYRAYKEMEVKTGLKLADLAERDRSRRHTFEDLQTQPRRLHNAPMWSGLPADGRPYSAFTYNVERMVPWRTLTGRQHLYLDHPGYVLFGEHLPTYKPKPRPNQYSDLLFTEVNSSGPGGKTLTLNYLTPHGKWHIHSTYGDNERMTTLSRGCEPFWISERDADKLGLADNDWVEVLNDHGVVVTRAAVSARIPEGICIIYHSPERTYGVPKSPTRGHRRAGGHNSLTRTRLKPNLMLGGYGQFTYHFNYWGPTGCNRDTHVVVRRLDRVEY
jgi:nitrate reductase / nitrite oxidoreductase, alpha subunit